MNELKTYTCIQCKKEYQSNEIPTPYCFHEDKTPFRHFDSKKFCSKECYLNNRRAKIQQTKLNNPEIEQQRRQKISNYYNNHPDKLKEKTDKRKQTLKNNPNIMKQIINKRRETLKNNPEIDIQRKIKRAETFKNNSEIQKQANRQHKLTLKNNPEIDIQREQRRQETLKQDLNYRQKLSNKVKETLKNNPEIIRNSVVRRQKTYKLHPEIKEQALLKRRETYKNHPEITDNKIKKLKLTYKNNLNVLLEQKEHRLESLKKNNTFNTSKPEDDLYELLKSKYLDVKRNYNSDPRYPFMCDFYIPSKDLFIELQLSWTHGSKPFIDTDPECQKQLDKWKQKSLTSKYYKNAIETWTIRDVNKRQIAKQNHLNYIEVWSNDFNKIRNI